MSLFRPRLDPPVVYVVQARLDFLDSSDVGGRHAMRDWRVRLFTLDGTDVGLDSELSPAEVAALPTAGDLRIGAQRMRVGLSSISVGGAAFDAEVWFEEGAMRRVLLMARRPGDARSWQEWTKDQEVARKAFHEEWATRVLGAAFEPLRIELDGTWIATEWPEPAPRQATFPWGQLRSVYDDHAAQAELVMLIGYVGG